MTPKEKAKELIDRFSIYVDFTDDKFNDCEKVIFNNSKNCALVVVDEILKGGLQLRYGNYINKNDKFNYYSYWVHVKNEIEKLNEINKK